MRTKPERPIAGPGRVGVPRRRAGFPPLPAARPTGDARNTPRAAPRLTARSRGLRRRRPRLAAPATPAAGDGGRPRRSGGARHCAQGLPGARPAPPHLGRGSHLYAVGCRSLWATPRGGVAPTPPLRPRGFVFFAENRTQPPPKLKLDQCEYQARCLSRFRSPEVPSAGRHPPSRRAEPAPPAASTDGSVFSAEALPKPPPEKYSPASHAVHLANSGGKN